MNFEAVEKIARAVLYEGFMLYPYTASSLKNQQRWNFGVLCPRGSEPNEMRTEVLVEGKGEPGFRARVRFLWYGDGEEPDEHAIDLEGCEVSREVPLPHGGVAKLEISAEPAGARLRRISVRVRNDAAAPGDGADDTRRSMLSTHTILSVENGAFVSLMDPPPECREAAKRCRNIGTWPVLAGAEGERHLMLSSPIILYDYPQVAPESPGDLFDATEIDEILTLRILTLSDSEKAEIREGGTKAREVLERAESLPPEHLMKLHGAVRGLKRAAPLERGDRVRLRPRKCADIFDIALAGKIGTVEAVEEDYEGNLHVAVVLEDDPGRELGLIGQPGHRFFFGLEEVEPLS